MASSWEEELVVELGVIAKRSPRLAKGSFLLLAVVVVVVVVVVVEGDAGMVK